MAEEWFKVANENHFWIKRRFEVLRKMGRDISFASKQIGEIGCGYGLVQKQLEQHYGVMVDGFDLNADALRDSVAGNHPRYCYNIFDRNQQFASHYDFLILFDVIEHIEQEKSFLDAVLYHLKAGGYLLINVPALMSFYSIYDKVVGHQRALHAPDFGSPLRRHGIKENCRNVLGAALDPHLVVAEFAVGRPDQSPIGHPAGLQTARPPRELELAIPERVEPLPQRLLGTSLMVVFRKEANP